MHALQLRPPPLTPSPPSSSSSSSALVICSFHRYSSPSFLFSFRPNKRFHFLKPCSSLKQSQKQQTLQKSAAPQSLKWFFGPKGDGDGDGGDDGSELEGEEGAGGLEGDTAVKGTILAGVLLIGVVGGFATVGYIYKDQINTFLNQFSTFIEGNSVSPSLLVLICNSNSFRIEATLDLCSSCS